MTVAMDDCANNKMSCGPETASMFLVPIKSIIKSSRGWRMKQSLLSEFQSAVLAEVPSRTSGTILEILEAKKRQHQKKSGE